MPALLERRRVSWARPSQGADELFYLCDECDALWLVEQFEWDNYTAGPMDRSQALEARGLRRHDYEPC